MDQGVATVERVQFRRGFRCFRRWDNCDAAGKGISLAQVLAFEEVSFNTDRFHLLRSYLQRYPDPVGNVDYSGVRPLSIAKVGFTLRACGGERDLYIS